MFTGKRLLLLGFILLLLIATPATVYFVQKQQEVRSHATASTKLTFYGDDALSRLIPQTNPLVKSVGDVFPVFIGIDPDKNLVASVVLHVKYDPSKLEIANTGGKVGFERNKEVFGPEPIEGPKYSAGEVAVWITTGTDVTTAIQAPNKPKLGAVTFRAIAGTGSTPTAVEFTQETQVNAWGSNATAGENVLFQRDPGFITINGSTPAATATPTQAPGATATPTQAAAVATPTPATVFATATPTLAATGPGNAILGMGTIAGIVTIIGAVLFFVL